MKTRILCFIIFYLIFEPTKGSFWPPGNTTLKCDTYNTEQQYCQVSSPQTTGFIYNNLEGTLEFTGVVSDVRSNQNCEIYIYARSVSFLYTNLTGCDILINATIVLKLQNSEISVQGSRITGPGNRGNAPMGSCFASLGGFCSQSSFATCTYGDYNVNYESSNTTTMFGSGCGKYNCSGN